MPRLLAAVAAALVLSAAPLAIRAQVASTCANSRATVLAQKLSDVTTALLTKASQDPVIGCRVYDGQHHSGDFTVDSNQAIRGSIVVIDGNLRVVGTVSGDAIVINGAAVIDSSGHVTGDVIAAERGATVAVAGRVDGEVVTLDAVRTGVVATTSARQATLASMKRTAAWFGVLLLLGIGVLVNSADAMHRVTGALNAGFARNVSVGFLAQLAVLPVLVIICLMLALTILGILLVPFAIVAYVIALLGLVVLGGLGAAQMVGRGVALKRASLSDRGALLQSLIVGMVLLLVPWLVAAGLTQWPVASAAVRTLAFGITWIAVTAGFGAALRTRGGTRAHDEPWGIKRTSLSGKVAPLEVPANEWLTPTPITGVVAVKRPTVGAGSSTNR
jgi:hypothetical protein